MNEDRWEEIKHLVKNKFELEKEEKVKEEEKEIERLIFQGPLGRMKLEWITKPRVIDIKTSGSSRRGGVAQKIEKVYSQDEFVSFLKAFVYQNNAWVEMEAGDALA
jgi:hypothetical protein